jgi:hypothetical protein
MGYVVRQQEALLKYFYIPQDITQERKYTLLAY